MEEFTSLFAKQEKIYPKRTWGRYRKLKWVTMVTLLSIYYLVPWIRWDRGAHMPDQAVLIDMPSRRAYFFFLEIWPQEVYYITGLLILAAVGLFFVTSLLGRVWCGYACPQTVWTDLFVWVERLVQGDRNARMKLDQSPWTLHKWTKKGLTHLIWIIIGLFTGGAWVFYFNDAPTLVDHLMHLDLPWSVGGWIVALTFSTYLMAGFAREQVCQYMCPYARFQSAMFDKDTLIISYDEKRGEPRGKHKQGESWDNKGHCVDCDSCVVVCPVGIDIRKGLQMECIACGLCVDACNNVMHKLGLPPGLIRYDTENNRQLRKQDQQPAVRLLRPRTLWYSALMIAVGAAILYGLLSRSPVEFDVMHDRNPLFVKLSDGDIRNGYNISILNKTGQDQHYRLLLEGLEKATVKVQGFQDMSTDDLMVFADSVGHFRIFVSSPEPIEKRKTLLFIIQTLDKQNTETKKSVFLSKD
ncbi:MAG: cytochrome c oxidase accessory protein CcoG [Alphaproteobacteria bacterium]|nr:cytochrome c oxidase accessory protein CcoG [Alphaproteobacteria bacterium]